MKANLAFFLLFGASAFGTPDASEWTKPRNFHVAFEQEFERKIEVIEKAKVASSESVTLSENEAYWFYVEPYNENEFKQRIILSGERMLTTEPNYITKLNRHSGEN